MSGGHALQFAFFLGVLFLWLIPGIIRIWMKREAMEVIGIARTAEEHRGYDAREWAVFFGLVAWLILFPLTLWFMDNGWF
jgi:hypothetical protein